MLFGAIGLRGASRAMQVSMNLFGLNLQIPSWHAGRWWLMRLGYYKLTRLKERANDWVWIVDHSIQIGSEKCLVILGIRLSNLPTARSLKFEDVEPIELIPVKKSNGEIVYEQLEAAVEKTGVPREIIADRGSDIKSGIDRFCARHKETAYIYDIKHALAILLEKELESDLAWKAFTGLCRETKQQVQQTELAPLSPPNQRSKSRYMNVDILINWGKKVNAFLNQSDEEIGGRYTLISVKEKLSWVMGYRFEIAEWGNIVDVIVCAENFVRENGLYSGVHLELENKLDGLKISDRAKRIKGEVIGFVRNEACKVGRGERLLGSSEIIESLFGKQKFIEKQQSRSGFTGLLLALAASVSKTTEVVIQKALESTHTKSVISWSGENIGKSVQARRLEALNFSKQTEQKQYQVSPVATG